MPEKNNRSASPAISPLVLTRLISAPRELVFNAWIDPRQLEKWWGPRGFTNPVCEIDVRVGGQIRIDMKAPDGTVYPMSGEFREIEPPSLLVFTSAALDRDGKPMFKILNRVEFETAGNRTRVTVSATPFDVTSEAAPYLAGMEQGWNQSLDRLDELATKN